MAWAQPQTGRVPSPSHPRHKSTLPHQALDKYFKSTPFEVSYGYVKTITGRIPYAVRCRLFGHHRSRERRAAPRPGSTVYA